MVIGAAAGVLGGLAGVGGSMVMIPALGLLMGFSTADKPEQHLYQAAAMAVNVLVAAPGAYRHQKAKAIRWDLFKVLAPVMTAAIIAGVLISNLFEGVVLKYALAIFIIGDCGLNLFRAASEKNEPLREDELASPVRLGAVAVAGGLTAGVLGIGGGVLVVPLLQIICRINLRAAIATSLATMSVTALVGAMLKIGTLGEHNIDLIRAFQLVLALAPGAILASYLGAALNHRLPLGVVRIVISILLIIVAIRLMMS